MASPKVLSGKSAKLAWTTTEDHLRGSVRRRPSLAETVEAIGFGPAQILVLTVGAGGVFYCEGVGLIAFFIITKSLATEIPLSGNEESVLTTMAFVGLFLGITTAGSFADVVGRRLTTVFSFGLVAFSLLLTGVLTDYASIVGAASAAGFGMGFGMPPSIAHVSEITPRKWRLAMRAFQQGLNPIGGICMVLVGTFDDPTMTGLRWQRLLIFASAPAFAWTVLALLLLPESPIFLATRGKHSEAQKSFRWMCRLNCSDCTSTSYEPPVEAGTDGTLSLWEQLGIVFSPQLLRTTLVTTLAAICLNMVNFGTLYANPQVFIETSTLVASTQLILSLTPGIIACVVGGFTFHLLERKTAIITAMSIASSSLLAIVIAGGKPPPRSTLFEALFQYGSFGPSIASLLGFTVIFQLAVESYPTAASATGGSVIIGCGRIGAIAAPYTFETARRIFRAWQPFYLGVSMACALSTVMMWLTPRPEKLPQRSKHATADRSLPGSVATAISFSPSRSYRTFPSEPGRSA